MHKNITRRTFLKNTSAAAMAGTLYLNYPLKAFADSDSKTKVVLIRDENVLDSSGKPKAKNLELMIDEAVQILTDNSDTLQAWQQLIKPEDVLFQRPRCHFILLKVDVNQHNLKN